ncbi:MAG TPA: DUF4065 domain-containing protein [Candidatus Agathobaculum merdipullorum]|nr:DUF4065 domain-containing protein [Candidatus Agathobaculum merdipullorum]
MYKLWRILRKVIEFYGIRDKIMVKGGERMYLAKQVAQYIINKCSVEERPVSNLKLQKLLYFAWIEYRKRTGKKLFDDKIYAWQFGPVVPEVYYDYCAYGGMDIDRRYDSSQIGITESDAEVLDASLAEYLNYSVSRLVSKTHERGKPWHQVYVEQGGIKQEIPFSLIEQMECQ